VAIAVRGQRELAMSSEVGMKPAHHLSQRYVPLLPSDSPLCFGGSAGSETLL